MNRLIPLLAAAFMMLAAAPAGNIIIINPGCDKTPDSMKRWSGPLSRNDLREWAAARDLRLVSDAPPLVDDCASMIRDDNATVVVSGMDRNRRYTLWIDFVRFVPARGRAFQSDLKLHARTGDGRYMLLGEYSFGSLPRGPVRLEIPYELSAPGRLELRFTEMSTAHGFWGVWDILVSVGELPDRINPDESAPDKMETDIKPLE